MLRRAFFRAVGFVLRVRRGFRVVEAEAGAPLPRPVVIVCNHAALLDSVFLICAFRRRFTICGARPVYFSTLGRRLLMRLLNIIPVEGREGFVADCLALLERGESLLIYPEMGRNPDAMGPFREWAAQVLLRSGAAVLPCYIRGTTRGQDPRQVRVIMGEVMTPDPSADAGALTDTLREQILALAKRPA